MLAFPYPRELTAPSRRQYHHFIFNITGLLSLSLFCCGAGAVVGTRAHLLWYCCGADDGRALANAHQLQWAGSATDYEYFQSSCKFFRQFIHNKDSLKLDFDQKTFCLLFLYANLRKWFMSNECAYPVSRIWIVFPSLLVLFLAIFKSDLTSRQL